MSFVGLVTQKDKPTGVSLRAKVVTENKKKSATKIFKVSVKADALDDFTCCVLDHATIVEKINAQEVDKTIEDINLTYNGINETTISYRIIDVDVPYLSQYLGEDGKILGRPKYGEGDASGYLEITVTKGEEKVVSRIQTSVKQRTALEVLSDAALTEAGLWVAIRGKNDPYAPGNIWSGHNNIIHPLSLVSSRNVDSMSVEPVAISWSVEDGTLAYANGVYTEARINAETGEVARCSYKDACKLLDAMPDTVNIELINQGETAGQNRVRIGNITLTATLTLGEETRDVKFNCATVSKYITNSEVLEAIMTNQLLYISKPDGTQIKYRTLGDSSQVTVLTAPSSGGTYELQGFGNKGSETFAIPSLCLEVGDVTNVTISHEIKDFEGSNAYANGSLLVSGFGGGFVNDGGETYMKLVIDYNQFETASVDDKKFACGATITVGGYSKLGDVPNGEASIQKVYAQFQIDTSAM